jgi:hypothetical protein
LKEKKEKLEEEGKKQSYFPFSVCHIFLFMYITFDSVKLSQIKSTEHCLFFLLKHRSCKAFFPSLRCEKMLCCFMVISSPVIGLLADIFTVESIVAALD